MLGDFLMRLAKHLSEIYFKRSVSAFEKDARLANQFIQKAFQLLNQAIDFQQKFKGNYASLIVDELSDD
jgi:hypothetical protein